MVVVVVVVVVDEEEEEEEVLLGAIIYRPDAPVVEVLILERESFIIFLLYVDYTIAVHMVYIRNK